MRERVPKSSSLTSFPICNLAQFTTSGFSSKPSCSGFCLYTAASKEHLPHATPNPTLLDISGLTSFERSDVHRFHTSHSGTAVAQPRFLYPGQLPPWVPSHSSHPVPKLDSDLGHVFLGPRPPPPPGSGAGEENSPPPPNPHPSPRPGTPAAVSPAPEHIPQPRPQDCPCSRPAPPRALSGWPWCR